MRRATPFPFAPALLFALALLLAAAPPARGATFQLFAADSGLPDPTVTAVAVQGNAVVWVGTINGLARFDGVDWVHYTKKSGALPDDTIWSLDLDEGTAGVTLWAGTGAGLASYDGSTWRHYRGRHMDDRKGKMQEGNAPLAGNVIHKVRVIKSPWHGKSLVFVVAMGKLYKFDGRDWSTFSFGDRMKGASITCIDGAGDDRLYIGTDSAGLVEFNLESMKSVFMGPAEGLPSNYITALHAEAPGDLWIGTDRGLARLAQGALAKWDLQNSKLPSNYITCVAKGFHNNVLVGTDKGLALHSVDTWEGLPESLQEVARAVVWDIDYFNPAGKDFTQTWIGTRGRGVAVYQVPKDPKADLAENKGRQAKQAFLAKRYVDAIQYYKELVNLNPQNLENHLYVATSYMELGDLKNAEHYLKQAQAIDPKSKPALEKLGQVYMKMDDLPQAEKAFSALVANYPSDLDGYLALGRLYVRMKKFEEAVSQYRRALRLDPDLPSIYTELSDCHLAQNNLMKALDVALQLQYKLPDNAENNVRIGRVYLLQNRLDDAVEEFNKVFLVDDRNALAKIGMAHVHVMREQFDKAEPMLREALKAMFKSGEAHALLAVILVETGKNDQALLELNYAKSFDPNHSIAKYAEGRLLEGEGKFEEASVAYKAAMLAGMNNGNIYYRYGTCLKSLESYDEALEAFRNVLAVEPTFKKAEDVKWIISKLETPSEEVVPVSDPVPGAGETPAAAGTTGTGTSGSGTTGTGGQPAGTQPNIEELDF